MNYDFETILDRSSWGSRKWAKMKQACPDVGKDVLPMSTADMEFMTAPEIQEGLKHYIDTVSLGYTDPTPEYYKAVLKWQKERHHFDAKADWIVTTSGVVEAIHMLINLVTEPGDGIIVQQPVYYPFTMVTKLNGRKLVNNELIEKNGTYEMDYEDLEEKARDPRNKAIIICNPHNPVGKVWSREELQKMMDICIANDVFVIDDEIHNDLIMPGYQHTALPSISQEAAMNCAYCTAPSKTFNLAGMQLSNIFIANPKVRMKLAFARVQNMNISQVALSYEACRLAYEEAGPWLDELVRVVDGNAKYVERFLAEHMPQVKCYPLEGTYLQWVDFRGLGMTHKEVEKLMLDAQLILDNGAIFGQAGRGFERFNIAVPRSAVEAAMERLLAAWKRQQEEWQEHGRPEHITLEPGMDMPDFTYDTPFASGLSFAEESAGKPTALIFHRYYSCSLCSMAINNLAAGYEAITAAGGQIKVVMQSQPQRVYEEMGGENRFPFEIICDPDRRLYERFNIFTADSETDLMGDSFQDVLPMLEKMMGGGMQEKPEGAQDQLPAYCIIDAEGKIINVHYGTSLFDTPDTETLVKLLQA